MEWLRLFQKEKLWFVLLEQCTFITDQQQQEEEEEEEE